MINDRFGQMEEMKLVKQDPQQQQSGNTDKDKHQGFFISQAEKQFKVFSKRNFGFYAHTLSFMIIRKFSENMFEREYLD